MTTTTLARTATVSGVAAVFGQPTDLGLNGYEELARTAFDDVLRRAPDVRALVNHDPSQLLARTGNGSLRLKVTGEGLAFDLDLPDTSLGRDVREMVGADLLNQMSFAFVPGRSERSSAPDGRQVRTHTSVRELVDVSLVTYPAYEGTSAELRYITVPVRHTAAIKRKSRQLLRDDDARRSARSAAIIGKSRQLLRRHDEALRSARSAAIKRQCQQLLDEYPDDLGPFDPDYYGRVRPRQEWSLR